MFCLILQFVFLMVTYLLFQAPKRKRRLRKKYDNQIRQEERIFDSEIAGTRKSSYRRFGGKTFERNVESHQRKKDRIRQS